MLFKTVKIKAFAVLIAAVTIVAAVIIAPVAVARANAPYIDQSALVPIDDGKPVVYLTFDDGPSRVTSGLLDLLAKKDVRATFFVTGKDTADGRALYKRMVDEGHAIGLHSYSHQYGQIYRSADAYMADMNKLDALIFDAAGVHAKICRFPGGSVNGTAKRAVLRDIASAMKRDGYIFFDWTVCADDATSSAVSADTIAARVIKRSAKFKGRNLIVLLHDDGRRTTCTAAVEQLIKHFSDEGYVFDKLSEETRPVQYLKY